MTSRSPEEIAEDIVDCAEKVFTRSISEGDIFSMEHYRLTLKSVIAASLKQERSAKPAPRVVSRKQIEEMAKQWRGDYTRSPFADGYERAYEIGFEAACAMFGVEVSE